MFDGLAPLPDGVNIETGFLMTVAPGLSRSCAAVMVIPVRGVAGMITKLQAAERFAAAQHELTRVVAHTSNATRR